MRNKDGFTLIELLVVIAIIAILAAIMFPVFVSAKESANRTKCCANMKQIGTALLMYTDDYSGRFPSHRACLPELYEKLGTKSPVIAEGSFTGSPGVCGLAWLLNRYIKNAGVWMCPAGAQRDLGGSVYKNPPGVSVNSMGWKLVGWVKGTGMSPVSTNYISWQFNRYVDVTATDTNSVDKKYPDCAQGRTLAQYAVQGARWRDTGGGHYVYGANPKSWGAIMMDAYYSSSPYFYCHKSGSNLLYCDGHSAWFDDARNNH